MSLCSLQCAGGHEDDKVRCWLVGPTHQVCVEVMLVGWTHSPGVCRGDVGWLDPPTRCV